VTPPNNQKPSLEAFVSDHSEWVGEMLNNVTFVYQKGDDANVFLHYLHLLRDSKHPIYIKMETVHESAALGGPDENLHRILVSAYLGDPREDASIKFLHAMSRPDFAKRAPHVDNGVWNNITTRQEEELQKFSDEVYALREDYTPSEYTSAKRYGSRITKGFKLKHE
jgi:hypothetical protein